MAIKATAPERAAVFATLARVAADVPDIQARPELWPLMGSRLFLSPLNREARGYLMDAATCRAWVDTWIASLQHTKAPPGS